MPFHPLALQPANTEGFAYTPPTQSSISKLLLRGYNPDYTPSTALLNL